MSRSPSIPARLTVSANGVAGNIFHVCLNRIKLAQRRVGINVTFVMVRIHPRNWFVRPGCEVARKFPAPVLQGRRGMPRRYGTGGLCQQRVFMARPRLGGFIHVGAFQQPLIRRLRCSSGWCGRSLAEHFCHSSEAWSVGRAFFDAPVCVCCRGFSRLW